MMSDQQIETSLAAAETELKQLQSQLKNLPAD